MRRSADGPLCRATVTVAVALIDIISRWDNMPFPQLSIPGSATIPIGVRCLRSLREPSSHTPINLEAVLRCLSVAASQKDGMGQASLRRRPCFRQQISALLDPHSCSVSWRSQVDFFAPHSQTSPRKKRGSIRCRIAFAEDHLPSVPLLQRISHCRVHCFVYLTVVMRWGKNDCRAQIKAPTPPDQT